MVSQKKPKKRITRAKEILYRVRWLDYPFVYWNKAELIFDQIHSNGFFQPMNQILFKQLEHSSSGLFALQMEYASVNDPRLT